MADFRFGYPDMQTTVERINDISTQFASAADKFQGDFSGAVANWEGASKEQMMQFIDGPVMEYLKDTIPKIITSLATLLTANIEQMQKADQQVADSIPKSLS